MQDKLEHLLLKRPPSVPQTELPTEAPNRPIGQNLKLDAFDLITGLLGAGDPLDPNASKATVLGGGISPVAAMAGGIGKIGKGTQDAVNRIRELKGTAKNFHNTVDSAMERVMLARPDRRKADMDAVRKAYDEYSAVRGGPEVKLDMNVNAPSKPLVTHGTQPSAFVSDNDAIDWSTKLLQVATKLGYKPTGNEMSRMLQVAKIMQPRQGHANVTPAEFAMSVRGSMAKKGFSKDPFFMILKHPEFFRQYNALFSAGPKKTLGTWGKFKANQGKK